MDKRAYDAIVAFEAAHGGSESAVLIDGMYYFPDGATRYGNAMRGPATGPDAKMQIAKQWVYVQTRLLKRATEDFDELKEKMRRNPHSYMHHVEEHENRLKELQQAVLDRQKALADAQHELDINTPGYRSPEEQRQEAESQARAASQADAFLARIKKIEV